MKRPEYVEIGRRIAAVRLEHKVTQESLAEMMNVTPKHISCVENASSSFSMKQFIAFCRLFDCSLDYLIFGKSVNPALSKLPESIVDILYLDKSRELDKLLQYLQFFVDLSGK